MSKVAYLSSDSFANGRSSRRFLILCLGTFCISDLQAAYVRVPVSAPVESTYRKTSSLASATAAPASDALESAFPQMLDLVAQVMRRQFLLIPGVEVGPGQYKTEIQKYPPGFFHDRIRVLLELKQKRKPKRLNPIKE